MTEQKSDKPKAAADVTRALIEPFSSAEVRFKPQAVKNNKALAVAYVDARVVQDRLDDVLGIEGWQDEYELLPDGSAVCRLRCKIAGEWLTKMDVGSPSEQPDAGDRVKASFSDALKRAAVKFGVGRYLYRLPLLWADYDPQGRRFVRPPALPHWALPALEHNKERLKETLQEAAAREGKGVLDEQVKEIAELQERLAYSDDHLSSGIARHFAGKKKPADLTAREALKLINLLKGQLATAPVEAVAAKPKAAAPAVR